VQEQDVARGAKKTGAGKIGAGKTPRAEPPKRTNGSRESDSQLRSRKPLAEVLGEKKVAGLHVNLQSMALVSNIHRASAAIREHFERFVLTEADLHWSAFVTLWCLWIFGELETRKLAVEAGVAKSTLSGILNALEEKKLVKRRANEAERRLVIVNLTPAGNALISSLFPRFNAEETRIVGGLTARQMQAATDVLRAVLATIDEIDGPLREH
jgi:DNA-binding MarR family transcriptional regulator